MADSTLVRHQYSVPEITSVCGPLRILSTEEDCTGASVALLQAIGWGSHHYHQATTEFYYVVGGRGKIRLGDEIIAVFRGSFLVIPPNVGHQVQATPEFVLQILVVASPAWRADDEFVIEAEPSSETRQS